MIGSQDLLVGLAIVLFLFGAKKLPELAASLGKSMKEFKKGVSETGEEEPSKAPTLHTVLSAGSANETKGVNDASTRATAFTLITTPRRGLAGHLCITSPPASGRRTNPS